jgi:transposase
LDFLGIDVGKDDLHAAILQGERSSTKSVPNSANGIKQLLTWIKNRKVENVHACLESTGGWSEAVGLALHKEGYVVSIVNPCRIKAFAQSELLRTKTDAVDAALIARFCRMHKPERWEPPTPEVLALQAFVRRYQSLTEMLTEEKNRLGAPMVTEEIRMSVETHIEHLTNELERIDRKIDNLFEDHPHLRKQRDLLTSIPGIGKTTAARILGEMPNIAEFRDVKAVAAFAGLSPRTINPARFVDQAAWQRPAMENCVVLSTFRLSRLCALIRSSRTLPIALENAGKPKCVLLPPRCASFWCLLTAF